MAVAAAAVEEDDEQAPEHEQVLFIVVVAESSVLPLPLPNALGDALSGNATKEEEEEDECDMALRGSRARAPVLFGWSGGLVDKKSQPRCILFCLIFVCQPPLPPAHSVLPLLAGQPNVPAA